jgi:SsrA-binding protein
MKYVQNKKAGLSFTILETFEAGIELLGLEVKSVKKHQGTLDGARVILRGGEAFVIGLTISPYQAQNTPKSYDESRVRKLLLSQKEIALLYKEVESKRLTIIPLSLYGKGRLIKCEIALAKQKSKGDKRESLKEKDSKRDLRNVSRGMQ